MPAFSGQFNWREGLVWQVGFFAAEEQSSSQAKLHICDALVDTGASQTCISRSVAGELKLEPTGKIDIQTAGGITAVNLYDVRFVFVLGSSTDSEGNQMSEFHISDPIRSPEFDPGNNRYKALIGRDILCRGVLTVSFDGHYSFSY